MMNTEQRAVWMMGPFGCGFFSRSFSSPQSFRKGRFSKLVLLGLSISVFLLGAGRPGWAEEGRVNVHLGLGAGLLLTDAAAETVNRAGLDLSLKVDVPLHRWIAPQIGYGLIYLSGREEAKVGVNMVMLGARVRLLNDEGGYLVNLWPKAKRGNAWGNLWVDIGVGYAHAPTVAAGSNWFAMELGVGYEFSLLGPLQIGPYIGWRHVFKTDTDASFLTIGVSISFGYPKSFPDRILDAKPEPEPEPEEKPNIQGREGDSDGDGVSDESDQCPTTPPGVEVDSRGCEAIRGRMVFPLLGFVGDTATLAPGAIFEIRRMGELLKAHSDALVEIGGHMESSLSPEENLRISLQRAQVVRDGLLQMGIHSGRLSVQGFGSSVPVNRLGTPEERRRDNTRIEFRFSVRQPSPEEEE